MRAVHRGNPPGRYRELGAFFGVLIVGLLVVLCIHLLPGGQKDDADEAPDEQYERSTTVLIPQTPQNGDRDIKSQAAVDFGRVANNLSLENGIEPYEESVQTVAASPGPNATTPFGFHSGARHGYALDTDAATGSVALLAMSMDFDAAKDNETRSTAGQYRSALGNSQQSSGSWNCSVVDTALASLAFQASDDAFGSNTTASVDKALTWLGDQVALGAVDTPLEKAVTVLTFSEAGNDTTAFSNELAAMQGEKGDFGDINTTAWAAIALSRSDNIVHLRSAGLAVDYLSTATINSDGELGMVLAAEAAYREQYVRIYGSGGPASAGNNSFAQPLSPDAIGRSGSGSGPPSTPMAYEIPGGILAFLLALLAALFVRLKTEERVLSGVRAQLLEYLRKEPGQHQAALQRQFGLSSGSAVYNLKVLEDKGYISSHRDGRHKRFYVNGNSLRPVANGMTKFIVSALRNVNTKRMVVYLLGRPGAAQKELSESLHLDPSTVSWHAERLRKVGMLTTVRQGRSIAYHLDRPEIMHQILSFIP